MLAIIEQNDYARVREGTAAVTHGAANFRSAFRSPQRGKASVRAQRERAHDYYPAIRFFASKGTVEDDGKVAWDVEGGTDAEHAEV